MHDVMDEIQHSELLHPVDEEDEQKVGQEVVLRVEEVDEEDDTIVEQNHDDVGWYDNETTDDADSDDEEGHEVQDVTESVDEETEHEEQDALALYHEVYNGTQDEEHEQGEFDVMDEEIGDTVLLHMVVDEEESDADANEL